MNKKWHESMEKDIEKCRMFPSKEGSQELFESLIAKYSVYDSNFKNDLQLLAKAYVIGSTPDYRRELKNVANKLEGYMLSDQLVEEESEPEGLLMRIFDNFIGASEKLINRKHKRTDFLIENEYDVQDLLESYLILYFDDVRREEWTPSLAGGPARQDFILDDEKIAIEAKMTRDGMNDRSLGDELILDIARYFEHRSCEKLFFFILDKDHRIGQYKQIKKDLEKKHSNVIVYFAR